MPACATRRSTRGCLARDAHPESAVNTTDEKTTLTTSRPLRVGIGGPVGSGKTALTLALRRALRDRYELAVVTNDTYTEEDARFLVHDEALAGRAHPRR